MSKTTDRSKIINLTLEVCLIFLFMSSNACAVEARGFIKFEKSNIVVHGEIDPGLVDVGVKLVNQVLVKDIISLSKYFDGLSKFAYKELYDSEYTSEFGLRSIYDILKDYSSLNIKIKDIGNGTKQLYFYDPEVLDVRFPLDVKIISFWKVKYATCVFEKNETGWVPYRTLFEGG